MDNHACLMYEDSLAGRDRFTQDVRRVVWNARCCFPHLLWGVEFKHGLDAVHITVVGLTPVDGQTVEQTRTLSFRAAMEHEHTLSAAWNECLRLALDVSKAAGETWMDAPRMLAFVKVDLTEKDVEALHEQVAPCAPVGITFTSDAGDRSYFSSVKAVPVSVNTPWGFILNFDLSKAWQCVCVALRERCKQP